MCSLTVVPSQPFRPPSNTEVRSAASALNACAGQPQSLQAAGPALLVCVRRTWSLCRGTSHRLRLSAVPRPFRSRLLWFPSANHTSAQCRCPSRKPRKPQTPHTWGVLAPLLYIHIYIYTYIYIYTWGVLAPRVWKRCDAFPLSMTAVVSTRHSTPQGVSSSPITEEDMVFCCNRVGLD
jgi:hypothetical protein